MTPPAGLYCIDRVSLCFFFAGFSYLIFYFKDRAFERDQPNFEEKKEESKEAGKKESKKESTERESKEESKERAKKGKAVAPDTPENRAEVEAMWKHGRLLRSLS